ncbi:ubiquitin hydrolase [Trypanosoma theileri]|uniref:ubiquitinyl hydrolase 1 n=1 Tax=Trypanosoma theileri TaxID=67003 RepID=A0A1X0P5M1_9TRYP|nr:ubiquitin hydrolase [Trypanosoma theileri]ORC91720.1 ubiquitin hydrolase [Trypanosoma theileri]
MSIFELDWECPYSEFLKRIHNEALCLNIREARPEKHYEVCDKVYKEAVENQKKGRYDVAFYYFLRCIEIFERTELRKKLPASKSLLMKCVDAANNLRTNELLDFYNKQIQLVKEQQEERQKIIELQHLHDEDDNETEEQLHLKRQQNLLMSEKNVVDITKKKLNETHIPIPQPLLQQNNVEPYWKGPHSTVGLLPGNHIEPLRKIINPSPNAYGMWVFNTGGSRMSYTRRGMVNLGNTCYLNSVTQMLFATPLGAYFLGDEYTKFIVEDEKGRGRLVNSLSHVMRELNRVDTDIPVSTSHFKRAIGEVCETFMNFSQQDANEFLHVLLDGIHKNLNEKSHVKGNLPEIDTTKGSDLDIAKAYWSQYTSQNKSVIVKMCIFQERNTLVCPLCHHVSRSFSPSLGIEVPIPSLSGEISIEDCLTAYCKEEVLDSDSLYNCPSCKKNVNASKQLLIYSLPKILFITIKRFRNFGDFSNKIMDSVAFQKQLDVSPFCCSDEKNTLYNLVGVVNHQGNIHGGHYTADSLGRDGCWCSFSDERVTEAQNPNFKLAYILCFVQANR